MYRFKIGDETFEASAYALVSLEGDHVRSAFVSNKITLSQIFAIAHSIRALSNVIIGRVPDGKKLYKKFTKSHCLESTKVIKDIHEIIE